MRLGGIGPQHCQQHKSRWWMNSSKRWELEELAHNTVDNTKADGEWVHLNDETWRNRPTSTTQKPTVNHVKQESAILGYWKKPLKTMWDTLMKLTFTEKCACCMNDASLIEWGGGVGSLEHGGAKTNESVCGCCLGTIREGAPPDLMNRCWDVSSSVCVE